MDVPGMGEGWAKDGRRMAKEVSAMAGDVGERARDARGTLRLVPEGSLRLFNTLKRTVEPVEPIEPGHARMYTCGPTVYRFVHVGNLRSFTMADWIRRVLTYHGLRVTHVKNIT